METASTPVVAVGKETTGKGVLTNPAKLDTVVRSAGKLLTFDGGGITMIKTNGGQFNPTTINGQAFETLNPISLQLLQAVRDDNVAAFVAEHLDWVAGDGPAAASAAGAR